MSKRLRSSRLRTAVWDPEAGPPGEGIVNPGDPGYIRPPEYQPGEGEEGANDGSGTGDEPWNPGDDDAAPPSGPGDILPPWPEPIPPPGDDHVIIPIFPQPPPPGPPTETDENLAPSRFLEDEEYGLKEGVQSIAGFQRGRNHRGVFINSRSYKDDQDPTNTDLDIQMEETLSVTTMEEIKVNIATLSVPNTFYQVCTEFNNRYFDVKYTGTRVTGGAVATEIVRFDLGEGNFDLYTQLVTNPTTGLSSRVVTSTLISRIEDLFSEWFVTVDGGTSPNWTTGSGVPHIQFAYGPNTQPPLVVGYAEAQNALDFVLRDNGTAGAFAPLPNGTLEFLMDPDSTVPGTVGLPPTNKYFPRLVGLPKTDGLICSQAPPVTLQGTFSVDLTHANEIVLHVSWSNRNMIALRKQATTVSTILSVVPIDVKTGELLTLEGRTDRPSITIPGNQISTFNIFLTTAYNEPINLRGHGWNCSIDFTIDKVPELTVPTTGYEKLKQLGFNLNREGRLQPRVSLEWMMRDEDKIITDEEAQLFLQDFKRRAFMPRYSDNKVVHKETLGGHVHEAGEEEVDVQHMTDEKVEQKF